MKTRRNFIASTIAAGVGCLLPKVVKAEKSPFKVKETIRIQNGSYVIIADKKESSFKVPLCYKEDMISPEEMLALIKDNLGPEVYSYTFVCDNGKCNTIVSNAPILLWMVFP